MILRFQLFPERFAIAHLAPDAAIPDWAPRGPFFSITRTADELSIIAEDSRVPAGSKADRGWRCLALKGPFAFSEIGIAAECTAVLASAGISVLVVSTYDTDSLLVAGEQIDRAIAAFAAAGHSVAR